MICFKVKQENLSIQVRCLNAIVHEKMRGCVNVHLKVVLKHLIQVGWTTVREPKQKGFCGVFNFKGNDTTLICSVQNGSY